MPRQSFGGITGNNTENLQEADPLLKTEISLLGSPVMKRGSAQNYESISQGGKTQSGASETHAEEKEETEQNKTTKTHSLEGINVQGAR